MNSKMSIKKLGIVTNPLELDEQDTFFLFVNNAISRKGLEVFVFDACDLGVDNFVNARKMMKPISFRTKARLHSKTIFMKLSDFDLIFLKKDPPIDKKYQYLLNKLIAENITVINQPKGILKMGTKSYLKHFPKLTPKTFYVHTVKDAIKAIKKLGNCVIKKSDSSGGKGVKHIRYNLGQFYEYKSRQEMLFSNDKVSEIVEKYLKNSIDNSILVVEYFMSAPRRGDKRVVILEGEILGSYIRLPNAATGVCVCGNNGARLYDPTDRDREIVKMIKPHLKKNGIELAALDLLVSKSGVEHLSEINVFNPGFCNLKVVHPELNIEKKIVDMLCRKMHV